MPRFLLEYPLSDADATSGTASVTGLTVTPVGRSGDYWYASYLTVGGDPVAHTPPGTDWELVGDSGLINATLRLSVWRKRAILGTFPVPFTHTGSLRAALSVRAFSNALGVEGTPAAGGNANVQSHTHTAHTALGGDRVWVLVTGKNTASAGSSAFNTPSGFTETADLCSQHGTNPNSNLAVHHKTVPAGSTGTQLVDSNDAVNRTYGGVGFLLKPRLLRLPR